ncbi:MAG: glycosyltransferase family 4 protein [Candidatus Margulisiibacteriota bacterium]|jgi:glycosyltransferase involved in cell wall biosynthesis
MDQPKKLKICFIGWSDSIHVQRWVQWFAERGHEVHLLSNSDCQVAGVTVHSLAGKRRGGGPAEPAKGTGKTGPIKELLAKLKFYYLSYLRYPLYIYRARKIIRELRPDILQAFYIGFGGYVGIFTGFHPFMICTGGADIMFFPRKFMLHRLMTRYVLKRADFIVHPSEESNQLAIKLGAPAERTAYQHFGVDLALFNPKVDPGPLLDRLGLRGRPVILSTRGLYDQYYNISGLLKAFALVVSAVPTARLILKYYSAPEINKFEDLAKTLGIYDKIIWVGKSEYESMGQYYRCAEVYVSLSYTDSGSLSMLEAMACGTTPVVSDLPNIREWIKPGWNGYLLKPDDVQGAAAAIIKVISDRAERTLYGERNVKLIEERADQNKCYRNLEKIAYGLVVLGAAGNKGR